ncbi:GHMP kinase [Fervidicoccus fontis Kam940]|uniref:Pantoate kinase n=1 Tax=Fervidicoccus fontis (strain DSM 19380 / JCM 18336 / VKM B-2539 / Kam940) TaxID=1163730 RepID=I0A1H2_FERFK|nr:GHMP kinase [Fervidicoccus fontis Kam940]
MLLVKLLRRNGEDRCIKIAHHISTFWAPVYKDNELYTGSIGAGILISPYAIACLNEESSFEEPSDLIKEIDKMMGREKSLHFKYIDELPPAYGYARSASLAIGYTFLSFIYENKKFTLFDIGRIAHVAEVRSKTGLGDVSAILGGRKIPIRLKAGAPGISLVDSLMIREKISIITIPLKKISTKDMLKNKEREFYNAGMEAMRLFLDEPDFEKLVTLAYDFSKKTGMLSEEVESVIKEVTKSVGIIGYFIKKGIVVLFAEEGTEDDVIEMAKKKLKTQPFKHKLLDTGIVV